MTRPVLTAAPLAVRIFGLDFLKVSRDRGDSRSNPAGAGWHGRPNVAKDLAGLLVP
jgi:hypothetical protein